MIFKFILFFLSLYFSILSVEVTIQGKVINGTTSSNGSAESIKILSLQDGMKPIHEISNIKGEFIFKNIQIPDSSPILLQVTSNKVNYNKLIPPTKEFQNKFQEILVYDKTDSKKEIEIKSLIQITKENGLIRVYKIILITNSTNPPKCFEDRIEVSVPKNAIDLYANLKQDETSKMGIPITLRDGKEGKLVERAILPGLSELMISYVIPSQESDEISFEDQMLFDKGEDRIVFFRPLDMKIDFINSLKITKLEKDIPAGMGAFYVSYPANGKIKINLKGGTPIKEELTSNNLQSERKVVNGTIFTTTEKSILGVIGFISLYVIFSFMFHRKNNND